MSYVSKVSIGNTDSLVGSTLYGICKTGASTPGKTVGTADDTSGKFINAHFDNLIQGTTIHVKFIYGNSATSNVTLAVGNQAAQSVDGKFVCDANTIISFTLDENQHWVVNDNVDTNTEYVFKTAYNATTNKALTESDINTAATKDVDSSIVESGAGANSSSTNLPTTAAVVNYVTNKTSNLSGLTGAMHFKGAVASVPPSTGTYESGDVVIVSSTNKEYVYDGSSWIELGDEGSYALKTNTDVITEVNVFTANTLPTLSTENVNASLVSVSTSGTPASLTTTTFTVPKVTQAGTATTASVANGVLTITLGSNTELASTDLSIKGVDEFVANTPTVISSTPITIKAVDTFTQGSQASLTTTNTTVVIPTAPASNS